MLKTLALIGALASTAFATTSANAAWIVSGRLVEERIPACTATYSTGCDLTSSLFPASIQGRLVEFVNVSCYFVANAALPVVILGVNGSSRFQHLEPASEGGTNGRSYNSQASFTIQATTTKFMTLTLNNTSSVSISQANCLLVGRLLD